jgi:hypothetical protein
MTTTKPLKQTITEHEEYWLEIEDKLARVQMRIDAIQRDIDQCHIPALEIMFKNERKRWTEIKRSWEEQQLRTEEWLMEHQAKGWVSS